MIFKNIILHCCFAVSSHFVTYGCFNSYITNACCGIWHRTCLWAPDSPYKLLGESAQPQRDLKPTKAHISEISTQPSTKRRSGKGNKQKVCGLKSVIISIAAEFDEFLAQHLQQLLREGPSESRNLSAPYPSTRAQTYAKHKHTWSKTLKV